jgi:hypothetical protein
VVIPALRLAGFPALSGAAALAGSPARHAGCLCGPAPLAALGPGTLAASPARRLAGAYPETGRYIGSADARSAEPRIRSVA